MANGDISFGRLESIAEINQGTDFIDTWPGDYDAAAHHVWNHDRNRPDLVSGARAGFGFWLQGEFTGLGLLRPEGVVDSDLILGAEAHLMGLKYFRLASFAGRGAARFMMTQLPHLALDMLEQQRQLASGADSLIMELDTRAGSPAETFFEHMGFRIVDQVPLYDEDVLDSVMRREYSLDTLTN